MNQSRFKIDDTTTSLCDHAIERKKLLEKLRRMDEETAEQDAEDEKENDENKEQVFRLLFFFQESHLFAVLENV